jgi:hypothetical protein
LNTDIQFGLNYLLLKHSSPLAEDSKKVIGYVNIGPDDLDPEPYPDEDPEKVTQCIAERIADTVIGRLGGSGRVLAVCVMPYYFRRPLCKFPPSYAAARLGFEVKSRRDAKASIVVATLGVIWDGSARIVAGRSTLSIPTKFRKFDRSYVDEFMDPSSYEESFAVHGELVNPYLLRMADLFTEESWGKACPIICEEIARRACRLMIA